MSSHLLIILVSFRLVLLEFEANEGGKTLFSTVKAAVFIHEKKAGFFGKQLLTPITTAFGELDFH